jgi:leucyl/phenylalanyl-tRNA--protein transferase
MKSLMAILMKIKFPDPKLASEEGIVAIGGKMTLENLLEAYSQGIFPWPHQAYPLLWFCPHERGIINFAKLHIPRSLKKLLKKSQWQVTWDKAFLSVIQSCAASPRPGQPGTWITEELTHCYQVFHKAGYAHSLEVWEGEELIGGIYGVFVKNVFSAESMFYKKTNASKFALCKLVEKLKSVGLEWMDVQMLTSITENFGGEYISQEDFLAKLKKAQEKPPILL